VNRVTRHGAQRSDADGVPTSFNPDPALAAEYLQRRERNAVRTTTSTSAQLTSMGGQPRNRIAKVSPDGTLDPNFNPKPRVAIFRRRHDRRHEFDVYVAADFSAIGGQPRIVSRS